MQSPQGAKMTDAAGSCPVCFSEEAELFAWTFDRVRKRPRPLWQINRCRDCGYGWTFPQLKLDEIASHYPPTYLGDTEVTLREFSEGRLQRSRSWRKEEEKVALVQRYLTGGRILDVGCGDGKFLWALEPGHWKRFGVEFAEETVKLVAGRLPDLEIRCGDIFHEGLEEGTFSAVTFWHVLEHLPFPRKVLLRARKLLKPGGWIFVSLPNLESLQARLFRRFWYAFDDVPRHLHHFSPASLEILLEDAGLEVCRHFFFSKTVNFHCLKYSLINWSEDSWGSRVPYYLLKPILMAFPLAERISGRYGMLATVGRKPL